MELKNLNIDYQLNIGMIFSLWGLFTIVPYSFFAIIFDLEQRPFIFIVAFLWISLLVFQLFFLYNARKFKTDPTNNRLRQGQRYFILYIFMFMVEILYFADHGFWYTDAAANIIQLFLLFNVISINRKIRNVDLAKIEEEINRRREEERERAKMAEFNRIAAAQKREEDEKKRKEEELRAVEKEKLEVEERERKRMLEEEEAHVKKLAEIASLIKQFSFDIPVSLSRISELLYDRSMDAFEISEYEVERLLIELLTYQDDLGEYLELEQVFIKRSKVNTSVDEVIINTKSNPFTAIHICNVCNYAQPVLSRRCTNCDNIMPFCSICGRGFGEEDNLSTCSHCETKFHSVHISAYIQSKGKCPVCREKLNETLLRSN